MSINKLIFVGLKGRVVALDRATGEIVWVWRAPKAGSGYVTLLLDKDRLIVSAGGYLYCLDPSTGDQIWFNPLKGFGVGVASIASVHGSTPHVWVAQAAEQEAVAAAAAAGAAASAS